MSVYGYTIALTMKVHKGVLIMNEIQSFGMNLRKYRISAGIIQDDMANALGVSRPYYGKIELGKRDTLPTKEQVEAIAKKLNVTTDMLYGKNNKVVENPEEQEYARMTTMSLRATSQTKYDSMYILAKHGISAQEVIDLTPKDIVGTNDSLIIKGAKLNLDEAKTFMKYFMANQAKIMKVNVVFFGQSTPKLNIVNMTRGFGDYLNKYKEGESLTSIGWGRDAVTAKEDITDFNDIRRMLEMTKGRK